MKITLKLFASLAEYLPAGAVRNAVQVEVPSGASLNEIIDRHRVPRDLAHLVLVNGCFAAQENRDRTVLNEGDTLAIWPPVAGG
jgi:molybdopterin converting factor small subunit